MPDCIEYAYGANPAPVEQIPEATVVQTIARNAFRNSIINQAARAIEAAAVVGQYDIVWMNPMPDFLKTDLEGKGYRVQKSAATLDRDIQYVISWYVS